MADHLLRENHYPYEVMPILYALCRSCEGIPKSVEYLEEGNVAGKAVKEKKKKSLVSEEFNSPVSGNNTGKVPKSRELALIKELSSNNFINCKHSLNFLNAFLHYFLNEVYPETGRFDNNSAFKLKIVAPLLFYYLI